MGIIRRIGRRVKEGLGAARGGGRSPAREVARREGGAPAVPRAGKDESKDFWFLDGSEADGWENTDAIPDE